MKTCVGGCREGTMIGKRDIFIVKVDERSFPSLTVPVSRSRSQPLGIQFLLYLNHHACTRFHSCNPFLSWLHVFVPQQFLEDCFAFLSFEETQTSFSSPNQELNCSLHPNQCHEFYNISIPTDGVLFLCLRGIIEPESIYYPTHVVRA